YAVMRLLDAKSRDFALALGAIIATQVGTFVWHRQAPASSQLNVKLGLGTAIATTAVALALVLQVTSGWLTYPEVIVPIAAIGSFAFPFAVVGSLWRTLEKAAPPPDKST